MCSVMHPPVRHIWLPAELVAAIREMQTKAKTGEITLKFIQGELV